MPDSSHKTDRSAAALERIERWLELLTRLQASAVLEKELSNTKLEQIYALTGESPPDEIAKKLRISKSTILAAHDRWLSIGLLVKTPEGLRKSLA